MSERERAEAREQADWQAEARYRAERERDTLREMLRESYAVLSDLRAAVKVACHHCGSGPDADGDHSCPCPNSDTECLEHTLHPVMPEALRALLAETDADNGCSTCGGTRLVDWEPGAHRDSEENQQPCPDCSSDADNGGGDPRYVPCGACGATPSACQETDGGCCDGCRATAGCSHGPVPADNGGGEGR